MPHSGIRAASRGSPSCPGQDHLQMMFLISGIIIIIWDKTKALISKMLLIHEVNKIMTYKCSHWSFFCPVKHFSKARRRHKKSSAALSTCLVSALAFLKVVS